MPIYWSNGVKPVNPVAATNVCNRCEPTMGLFHANNLSYDSERDANITVNAFLVPILNNIIPRLWTILWNRFRCTNRNCSVKESCGPNPTYIEVGSTAKRAAPGAPVRWTVYVVVAREIRCICLQEGQNPPGNDTPVIPTPRPPGGGTPPGGSPSPGGGDGPTTGLTSISSDNDDFIELITSSFTVSEVEISEVKDDGDTDCKTK